MDIVHRQTVEAACGCTSCVNLKEPRLHSVYQDRLIYFCSRSCKVEFEEDPAAFLESDHFKIEFDVLDRVEDRKSENLSEEEIKAIKAHRKELEDDGVLIHLNR